MRSLPKFVHAGIFGDSGVGKSVLGELVCEIKFLNDKMKIIDLVNDRYIEAVCFMGPTRIKKFQEHMKSYSGVAPMGFPVEIYHPVVTTLPKKLPENIKLYTLPMEFFSHEDVLRVLTNDALGDSAYVSLTQEIEKMDANESFPALPAKLIGSLQKTVIHTKGLQDSKGEGGVDLYFSFDAGPSMSAANRPLLKAKSLGVFSSENFPLTMTDDKLVRIMKDRTTITAFSTKFIPNRHKKLKLAINLYLMKKIRDMGKASGGGVLLYLREARNLLPNANRLSDKSLRVLGDEAEDMAKDCRKAGIKLIIDTQGIDDVPSGVKEQLDLKFIFRHGMREFDLVDAYRGIPGLDVDRIKNIKKLPNFRFYCSTPRSSVRVVNPFNGLTLDFRISDHLEENEDEIKFIKRAVKGIPFYQTLKFIDMLREDWKKSTGNYEKQFKRMSYQDDEKSMARSAGLAVSELRVMKFFASKLYGGKPGEKEIAEKTGFTFTQLAQGAGVAKPTLEDALNRLVSKGFMSRGEKGISLLTVTGMDFIEENKDIFENIINNE